MKNYNLLLGSKSPRRKTLLQGLELVFKTVDIDCDEIYPRTIAPADVPSFLSELKSNAHHGLLPNELLITADTVVVYDGEILKKPKSNQEALEMLRKLSGTKHQVITGICLRSTSKQKSFSESTVVEFHPLSDHEIEHYIKIYKPYDKAGSYGIQEWIGYIGVRQITGCYYNVMGLPLSALYRQLNVF